MDTSNQVQSPLHARETSIPERFVPIGEASRFLGVSIGYLHKMRDALPVHKFSGRLHFRLSELSAWAEQRGVQRTAK